jgi:hypothetical protein
MFENVNYVQAELCRHPVCSALAECHDACLACFATSNILVLKKRLTPASSALLNA